MITSLTTGGNKTGKLEFLMADALDAGADIGNARRGAVKPVRQTAAPPVSWGLITVCLSAGAR